MLETNSCPFRFNILKVSTLLTVLLNLVMVFEVLVEKIQVLQWGIMSRILILMLARMNRSLGERSSNIIKSMSFGNSSKDFVAIFSSEIIC